MPGTNNLRRIILEELPRSKHQGTIHQLVPSMVSTFELRRYPSSMARKIGIVDRQKLWATCLVRSTSWLPVFHVSSENNRTTAYYFSLNDGLVISKWLMHISFLQEKNMNKLIPVSRTENHVTTKKSHVATNHQLCCKLTRNTIQTFSSRGHVCRRSTGGSNMIKSMPSVAEHKALWTVQLLRFEQLPFFSTWTNVGMTFLVSFFV